MSDRIHTPWVLLDIHTKRDIYSSQCISKMNILRLWTVYHEPGQCLCPFGQSLAINSLASLVILQCEYSPATAIVTSTAKSVHRTNILPCLPWYVGCRNAKRVKLRNLHCLQDVVLQLFQRGKASGEPLLARSQTISMTRP